MDKLIEAINTTHNPSVVGLDPTDQAVPAQLIDSFHAEVADQVDDPA